MRSPMQKYLIGLSIMHILDKMLIQFGYPCHMHIFIKTRKCFINIVQINRSFSNLLYRFTSKTNRNNQKILEPQIVIQVRVFKPIKMISSYIIESKRMTYINELINLSRIQTMSYLLQIFVCVI